jgi:hypothetical protein
MIFEQYLDCHSLSSLLNSPKSFVRYVEGGRTKLFFLWIPGTLPTFIYLIPD